MITREDILRELELLPVWTLRNQSKLQEVQLEPTAEPVIFATVADVVIETPIVEEAIVEKNVKPWAFVCSVSLVQEAECTILMRNIIQATQLALDDYVLLPDLQALNNYQVTDVLLFGMDAAQSFLQMNVDGLDSLRGKAHVVEGVRVWVSYHPEQMLQNPMLKREVWRDIQRAMPHLVKQS